MSSNRWVAFVTWCAKNNYVYTLHRPIIKGEMYRPYQVILNAKGKKINVTANTLDSVLYEIKKELLA